MCTVGGRIGWIGTRSGTARRPGIADPTTLATKYYFFVQDIKRTIKATKHWSKNFPDAATIVCLSRLPCIYILPNCYDDEESNLTDPEDTDYIEVLTSDLLEESN